MSPLCGPDGGELSGRPAWDVLPVLWRPVRLDHECRNCIEAWELPLSNHLLTESSLHAFMLYHGVDVVSPARESVLGSRSEVTTELRSRDPFRASVTYEIDDDRLVLTLDENLDVVASERTETRGE